MNVSTKVLVQIVANTSQFIAGINQANKSMGLMQKSLVSLKNTLLGTFGAYAVINGIQQAVKTLAEFDKVMTQVSVITGSGKMTEGFNRLEQSALRLGSTTQYTAKQVAELQLEFGRLGFSTKEILQSTEATVNLATATGEGLARSAEIAGSTLRAFNLDASEMGRVTDVMAAALNNSALTLDSFADGIKYVSPVAAAVNVSLEETAAMMSVLADAGIKGTQAGTSLRRIFTMLTDEGKPLQERLDALAKAGINLAAANDEVGLYAQTALLVLTKYKPKIDELTIAYEAAKGQTQEMANAMQDNLATSITKVQTAWDSLILSFKQSGEIKDITDMVAGALRVFASNMFSGGEKNKAVFDALTGDKRGLQKLINELDTVQKEIDEARKSNEDFISDSAIALVRDYGDNIYGVKNAINETTRGQTFFNEILAEYSRIRKQQLIEEANALTEKSQAEQKSNEQTKEAIRLAYEISEIERQARIATLDRQQAGVQKTPMQELGIFSAKNSFIDPQSIEVGNRFSLTISSISDQISRLNYEQSLMNDGLKKSTETWYFWGDAVAQVLDNVIAKDNDYARSTAEVAARIIDSTRKEIAAYIAKAAAKALALNPTPAGIATASAIIGAGLSIVSGVLKKFAKTSDENVRISGARYNSLNFAPVTFRQRGTDLIGVISETDRLNSRTRG